MTISPLASEYLDDVSIAASKSGTANSPSSFGLWNRCIEPLSLSLLISALHFSFAPGIPFNI
ncbi:MAG: hypothetical protein ACJBCI_02260 [Candidatus Tisiphia sp.]|uniref:hypothetical protein n=1 Tax=Candidatus Tisiphia endosymbiont of Melanophora roralis TaxID=3066261 RepID=UPI001E7BBEC0|nr:MAG: hypothetical protein LF884_02500 [Rickettsia endosymbiont of Cimex lectularius]